MSTGYDNPKDAGSSEEGPYIRYTGKRFMMLGGPYITILRNDEPWFSVPCEDEEEAEWLIEKLTGSRRTD